MGVSSGEVVEKGLDVMGSRGLVYERGSETAIGTMAEEGVAGWIWVRRRNTRLRAGSISASPVGSKNVIVGVGGMSVGVAGG